MADGTYQAVIYPSAVHRMDENGDWKEIDNSLYIQNSDSTHQYVTADSRVRFAKELTVGNSHLFSLNENGYTISMSFINNCDISSGTSSMTTNGQNNGSVLSQASVVNTQKKASSNRETFGSLEELVSRNSTSVIKYKDIQGNTDIEYVLYGNDVKENIIIRSQSQSYEYRFQIVLVGLISEMDKSGNIILKDKETGKQQYIIPAPYMYDSSGEISYKVNYQLNEVKNGVYILTITADEEWINMAEREFPVVVDPTISSSTYATFDTYVDAANATTKGTNYGLEPTMWISNPYRTAFIKSTSMPSLPTGAIITNAKLNAAYYYYSGITGGMYITAHQVMKYWTETYSWNDMSNNGQDTSLGISSTVLSTTYLGSATSYPRWASIDVTNAAKSWYNGNTSGKNNNYGIALKYKSGNSSVILHTFDGEGGNTPYFTITYEIPNGVYAIRKAGTDVYVKNTTLDKLAWVFQGTKSTPPVSKSDRDYLFKIAYRPSTDDYVIRSMLNNAIFMYPSIYNKAPVAGKVTVSGQPATDSNISTEYTWKITTTSDGYSYIWHKDGDTTYYMRSTWSNDGGGSALGFTTNPNDTGTKWGFHKSIITQKGIDFKAKDSQIISAGSSMDLSSFASPLGYSYYSTTLGDNDPGNANYSVANISGTSTSIATISATGQLSTNSQKCGVIRVTVAFSKGVSFSANFYITPSSGEYFFLQNIQPSGGIGIGYIDGNSSGATKKIFTYDDTQLWQRIPSSWSGYYYIKNVGTGLYLSSPTSASVGTALSMVSTVTNDLQAWQFTKTSSGAWKIRSKNDVIAGRNLYVNIKSSSDNSLVQGAYVQNTSYLDEFNILTIGHDVVYNRTLTWPTAIDPSNMISDLSKYYDTYTLIQSDIYMDLPTAKSLLENSKIMVFNGHGSPSVITIHEKPQSYLRNYNIYDPSNADNSLDLSNIDIVFFCGCSTGGNPCNYCDGKGKHEGHFSDCPNKGSIYYNMPKSAQYSGAKVAIGWSVITYDNHMNNWVERFIHYMNTINSDTNKLYTAYEAYIKTNREITSGNADKAVIYGTDLDFRLSD